MFLTETRTDALTEVINIAFSRSAATLSEITGHRVLLEVPQVNIHPLNALRDSLGDSSPKKSPRFTRYSAGKCRETPCSSSTTRAPW